MGEGTEQKRPVMVWFISGYYFLTTAWALLNIGLIFSGAVKLPEASRALFEQVTALEWFLTAAGSIAGVAGSVSLFRMRKAAFPLFLAFFLLGVALVVLPWFTKDGYSVALPVLVGTAIAKIILLWVCVYIKDLVTEGVLK